MICASLDQYSKLQYITGVLCTYHTLTTNIYHLQRVMKIFRKVYLPYMKCGLKNSVYTLIR